LRRFLDKQALLLIASEQSRYGPVLKRFPKLKQSWSIGWFLQQISHCFWGFIKIYKAIFGAVTGQRVE